MDTCHVPTSIKLGTDYFNTDTPCLTLNLGAYTTSVAIQSQDMTSATGALQGVHRFDILPGLDMESGGLVNLGALFMDLTPVRLMRDVSRRGAANYEHLVCTQAQQADTLENEDRRMQRHSRPVSSDMMLPDPGILWSW